VGGGVPSGMLTILLHLPWLRHHGSGILTTLLTLPWLRLPASGCMAQAAGFGGEGWPWQAPDPCTLTPCSGPLKRRA